MGKLRGFLAVPLILAASVVPARASAIRDNAGLFSPDAVREAQAKLDRVEREYQVPATIETIETLGGRNIDDVLPEHAKAIGARGIYVLIAQKETKIEVERSGDYARAFPPARLHLIRGAFIDGFKKKDFDSGLKQGVQAIENEAAVARAETGRPLRQVAPAPGRALPGGRRPAPQGSFGLGSLLGLVLIIFAVILGIRLLGSLLSGGSRAGYAGRPGMGPGYGAPGYGGPGYGGRGGGFLSSMFGGIGGALAGNWLYDQFSGRHHQGGYADQTAYESPDQGTQSSPESAEWGGGDGGADWGGGGDSGGGGDWGGGGGDWGGGGGDWGGGGDGGGGGDW